MADAEEAVARVLYARHGYKYHSSVVEWEALEDKFRAPWLEDAKLAIETAMVYLAP
jgi:hypothetical protein